MLSAGLLPQPLSGQAVQRGGEGGGGQGKLGNRRGISWILYVNVSLSSR